MAQQESNNKLKMGYDLGGYSIIGRTTSQNATTESFSNNGVEEYKPTYQIPLTLTKYGSFPIKENDSFCIVQDGGLKDGGTCIITNKHLFPANLTQVSESDEDFLAGCVVSQDTLNDFASFYLSEDKIDGNDLKILAINGYLSAIVKLQKAPQRANVFDLLVVGISGIDSKDDGNKIGITPAVFLSSTYSNAGIGVKLVKTKDNLIKLGDNNTTSIINGSYNSKNGTISGYSGSNMKSFKPENGNGTTFTNYAIMNVDEKYDKCNVRFYVNELGSNIFGENGLIKKEAGLILPDKGDTSEFFGENTLPKFDVMQGSGFAPWLWDTIDRFVCLYETGYESGPKTYECMCVLSRTDNTGLTYGKWQTIEYYNTHLPSLIRIYLGIPELNYEKEICSTMQSNIVTSTHQGIMKYYELMKGQYNKNGVNAGGRVALNHVWAKNCVGINPVKSKSGSSYLIDKSRELTRLLIAASSEPRMQEAQDKYFFRTKIMGASGHGSGALAYIRDTGVQFPLTALAICSTYNWGPAYVTNAFSGKNFKGNPQAEKDTFFKMLQKRSGSFGQGDLAKTLVKTAQEGNWNLDKPFIPLGRRNTPFIPTAHDSNDLISSGSNPQ